LKEKKKIHEHNTFFFIHHFLLCYRAIENENKHDDDEAEASGTHSKNSESILRADHCSSSKNKDLSGSQSSKITLSTE
jgi:hypothetical protein